MISWPDKKCPVILKLEVCIFFMLYSSSRESEDVHSMKKIRDDKGYIFFHLDFFVPDKWILHMFGGPKRLATQTLRNLEVSRWNYIFCTHS